MLNENGLTLSRRAVARLLGVSDDLTTKLVKTDLAGAAVRIGGRIRYRRDAVLAFVESGGRPAERPAA